MTIVGLMVVGNSVELAVVVETRVEPFVGVRSFVVGPGVGPEVGESVVPVRPLVGRPHVGLVVDLPSGGLMIMTMVGE